MKDYSSNDQLAKAVKKINNNNIQSDESVLKHIEKTANKKIANDKGLEAFVKRFD